MLDARLEPIDIYLSKFFARIKDFSNDKDCWIWNAGLHREGYALFTPYYGGTVLAYRWFYQYLHGPVPNERELDHLCKIRSCVNPCHLEIVTHSQNMLRSDNLVGSHSKTHCLHGHEMLEENITWSFSKGYACRECRACKRARYHRYKLRSKN